MQPYFSKLLQIKTIIFAIFRKFSQLRFRNFSQSQFDFESGIAISQLTQFKFEKGFAISQLTQFGFRPILQPWHSDRFYRDFSI